MGKCVVCGKETFKTLFKKAVMPTYICSEDCLQKYFQPLGGVRVLRKLGESESFAVATS